MIRLVAPFVLVSTAYAGSCEVVCHSPSPDFYGQCAAAYKTATLQIAGLNDLHRQAEADYQRCSGAVATLERQNEELRAALAKALGLTKKRKRKP